MHDLIWLIKKYRKYGLKSFCRRAKRALLVSMELMLSEKKWFVRHTQKMYKKRERITRAKYATGERIAVGFFVSERQMWASQTVIDALLKTDRFTVTILVFPDWEDTVNDHVTSMLNNLAFFEAKNLNVVCGASRDTGEICDIYALGLDIVFLDCPRMYYELLHSGFQLSRMPLKFLVCYIPYGYKVADVNDAGRSHFNLPLHNMSWRVFAETSWHKEQFVKRGLFFGKNVVVSGSPKLDEYSNNSINEGYNKKANKKLIIWAPHWTINTKRFSLSTFDKYYKEFLDYARSHTEYYWVFKPHQKLFSWTVEIGLFSKSEVANYYNEWNNLPNAEVNEEGDYIDLFKISDMLITDCGAFVAEYLPSGHPVIHLHNDQGKYNEFGNEILQSYYEAYCFEDVEKYIKMVIADDDDQKKSRRNELIQRYFSATNAGEIIAQELIHSLSEGT